MKTIQVVLVFAFALVPGAALAQKWEIGAVGGGSFYTGLDVKRANATAEAQFKPGYAVGFVLSQEMGRNWGGSLRYTYLNNEAELNGTGGKASFKAQSHAIHYDFLLYLSPSGEKIRPFISFGAGIKHFKGTGVERVTQPLSEFALLTASTDTTPLASLGFGVKIRVHDKGNLRVEIKDYISPVPTKVFVPNRGSELSGWIHNFVPMVGITYVF